MLKKSLFIADLHLDPQQPGITALFEYFLSHQALEADALYILGDLFEAWVGDDDASEFHSEIKQALSDYVGRGKSLYIMRGNRDFMLGEGFCASVGATLLPDPTRITYDQTTVLLTHGDSLCTDDVKHQRYRRVIQHPLVKACLRSLPLSWRRRLAEKLRAKSRRQFLTNQGVMEDVNRAAVDEQFSTHRADVMIHGHTHRPGCHQHGEHTRYVLGAWHDAGYALRLHNFEVLTWTLPSEPKD